VETLGKRTHILHLEVLYLPSYSHSRSWVVFVWCSDAYHFAGSQCSCGWFWLL